MPEHTRRPSELDLQLQELLDDSRFERVVKMMTQEVIRRWHMRREDARQYFLSAIGDPPVLTEVYRTFARFRDTGLGMDELLLLCHRNLWKLLRKDATRPFHQPFPSANRELDLDSASGALQVPNEGERRVRERELRDRVNHVLTEFAAEGPAQSRQADLLRLRIVEGVSYKELIVRFEIPSVRAAYVRFHDAKAAFVKYVELEYPDLHAFLEEVG